MHSLYWRIFLAFWLAIALILIGTVTVAVRVDLAHRAEAPWVQRGQLYAEAARAFEAGGPTALRDWLQSLRGTEAFARTFVVEPSGRDVLGRPLPEYLFGLLGRPRKTPISPAGGALVLIQPDGSIYYIVVGPSRGPRIFGSLESPGVPAATLLIALVVSAVICFFLARYLVLPIDRLRHATRRMAAGDLNVRVLPTLKGRQDDLVLLAADLDTMAERVRNLLESKQQLLRDVSHELRSPLARLQLALSLARRQEAVEHSGAERHLARIACEADRLEQLIARTLKLARLERPAQGLEQISVNVGELLEKIFSDVAIEADAQGCVMSLQADDALEIMGDPELLRSAFENVIRNAVRYSPSGSQVGVSACRMGDAGEGGTVEIIVHDHGPGVPEKDLTLIFEPFYRVGTARDRAGGGEGLGLAIAARAVALHRGVIEARNLQSGGLAVSITLPAARATRSPESAPKAA